jgi:drug/metabolite transporter (DMT)-like permease
MEYDFQKYSNNVAMKWLPLSFIVLCILAFQDIVHRQFMKAGFQPIEIVLYGFIPSIICAIIYVYWKSIQMRVPDKKYSLLFIFSGILSFISFLLLREAQIKSPNIGYVNAIIYSSVVITIVVTSILFKDSFDIRGIFGAILIVLGLGLITSIKEQ